MCLFFPLDKPPFGDAVLFFFCLVFLANSSTVFDMYSAVSIFCKQSKFHLDMQMMQMTLLTMLHQS